MMEFAMRLAPLLLALPLLGAAPAPAPTTVTIAMSNFRFEPAVIRLKRGQPYVLHFVNRSKGGHNFIAPKFFQATRSGVDAVEVPGNSAIDFSIVAPVPGRYKVKCGHFMHGAMGMKGEVLVE
jgi:plastocyanin